MLNLLGASVGDEITIDYDMFQLLSKDFLKLKRLVFEYNTMNVTSTISHGEAVLSFLDMPIDAEINP